jgi:hypothetical protein
MTEFEPVPVESLDLAEMILIQSWRRLTTEERMRVANFILNIANSGRKVYPQIGHA